VETTSRRTDPAADPRVVPGSRPGPLEPLLQELQRISGHAESERAAADQALIADLRAEITALRAAVAHLRAGTAALPGHLRPVVARAMLATQAPATDADRVDRAATG
jgi:hypothetical protein